jgi:putative tryptophan/tyrosine transport system substrate-binding protein
MRRRDLTLGLAGLAGLCALPLGPLHAQDTSRLPKVALLVPSDREELQPGSALHGFLTRLKEFGYVDRQNISLEFRFADHAIERLPALAAELVATKPAALWTFTSGGARAAAAATAAIPIVIAPVAEETMAALVPDFADPHGNITGLPITGVRQREKCLQLLKEAAPGITRVGVLVNPLNPAWHGYPEVLNDAARTLGIELTRAEARGVAELEPAFAKMADQHVNALFALNESTLTGSTPALKLLVQLTTNLRLPSVSDATEFAPGGGLLGLGPDYPGVGRGAAEYIHRILQGTKVTELPVVLLSKVTLAVNLKTAQQLGITIPPSILLRADEVIE